MNQYKRCATSRPLNHACAGMSLAILTVPNSALPGCPQSLILVSNMSYRRVPGDTELCTAMLIACDRAVASSVSERYHVNLVSSSAPPSAAYSDYRGLHDNTACSTLDGTSHDALK